MNKEMKKEFTKIKSMSFPREIIAGHNAIDRLGELCDRFDLTGNALIVTGETTDRIFGETLRRVLNDSLIPHQTLKIGNATRANVNICEKKIRDVNASFLISLGGGSKIDIAKLAASELRIPFISVPTTASHDGISSPRASLKDEGSVFSVEAAMPVAIVADTALIVKSPFRFIAAGCADVIANLTALLDWELAIRKTDNESFSRTAFTMAKIAAETIIENAGNIKESSEESVWIVTRQVIASGLSMGVAGSSRPTSGSEHLFSHALDLICPGKALHGEQCGLGTIMMMKLHGGDWEQIRDALLRIGAPITAKAAGFTKDEIVSALLKAASIRPERRTILNEKKLDRKTAERLAKDTRVI